MRILSTLSIVFLSRVAAQDINKNECAAETFPVSVLGDQTVHCVPRRPCSGLYGSPDPVGMCPPGTGCALLPLDPNTMGCVSAGRTDVTYVNADGSLAPGPLKPTITRKPADSEDETGKDDDQEDDVKSSAGSAATPAPDASKAEDSTDGSKAPTVSPTTAPKTRKPSNSTSSGSASVASPFEDQNGDGIGDRIEGGGKNGSNGGGGSGLSSGAIAGIVIGILAIIAIIAGFVVLKKKREQAPGAEATPMPPAAEYGGGGLTPRENVLLL